MEKKYKDAKNVLIFNSSQVLVAIARSLRSAAELMNYCNLQAISFACTGKYVASGGYYFRHVQSDVEIRMEHLNTLNLQEYDRLCGEERKYYTKKQMLRAEKKYQWSQKKNSTGQAGKTERKPKGKADNSDQSEPQQ
ncbi:hypothetical protein [Viscerimonas tarda]|nr:hypothetical protein FACS189413_13400 [Bacteroidia bacterium]